MKKDRFEELTMIWLKKAKNDLLWAKDSIRTGHFGAGCFICQQIARKALRLICSLKRKNW